MTNRETLEALCVAQGLEFRDCGKGHVQVIRPGVLVNYWPESKRRIAYVDGGESIKYCTPQDVTDICLSGEAYDD